jgi:L-iditol 2-dehydrogenase
VCIQCKSGRYNTCHDMEFFATPPIDGGIAELIAI